jgi:hypothetical protein
MLNFNQHPNQSSTMSSLSPHAFPSSFAGPHLMPSSMVTPGSYYMPNVQLPDNGPPHHPPSHPPPGPPAGPPPHHHPGLSSDWIGPPTGPPPSAYSYSTPYGAQPGLVTSPWGAPMSTPFPGFGSYPLPPTNPPPGLGPYAPPPPTHPPNGYSAPYGTPGPQFSVPQGYSMAYTPAWVPASMPFAPPGPPGPPPPSAPPRPPERVTRAERYDKIGHFAAGPHCMRHVYLP